MPQKTIARRDQWIDKIADILLQHGVAAMPLRELAEALGTSDRMLLYYFGDRSGLVTAALERISQRLSGLLEQALPARRLAAAQLFQKLAAIMARPQIARILRVWADVTARGARDEAPFRGFALASAGHWLTWVDARLAIADRARRRNTAAALLVAIEGMRLMELSAPGTARGAAKILITAFADKD